MKSNINEDVQVQLTDHGRRIHREQHDEFNKSFPHLKLKYTKPKEDNGGWSKWQLWHLMQVFGPHIHLTMDNPFNLTIQL